MRFFVKNSVFGAVLCLSTSLFALSAKAASCNTAAAWWDSSQECSFTGTGVINGNGIFNNHYTADKQIEGLYNYVPVGARKYIGDNDGTPDILHWAPGGTLHFSSRSDGEMNTPNIGWAKDGTLHIHREMDLTSGGDLKKWQRRYYFKGGSSDLIRFSGGTYGLSEKPGYDFVRIIAGEYNIFEDRNYAAADLTFSGNIELGDGTFYMRAGQRESAGTDAPDNNFSFIGFTGISYNDVVYQVNENGETETGSFKRGASGNLNVSGGEFHIFGGVHDDTIRDDELYKSSYVAMLGDIMNEKNSTLNLTGGDFYLEEDTTLILRAEDIYVSMSGSTENRPKFLSRDGQLYFDGNAHITSALTSKGERIKDVSFGGGNANLYTDEFFNILRLRGDMDDSEYFNIYNNSTISVSRKLLQGSGSTIYGPDSTLRIEELASAYLNGQVIIGTLEAVDNGLIHMTSLQQGAEIKGEIHSIDTINVRDKGQFYALANLSYVKDLNVTDNGIMHIGQEFNINRVNMAGGTINLFSAYTKKDGTVMPMKPNLILQQENTTLDGKNLVAYDLLEYDLPDEENPFHDRTGYKFLKGGSGTITLTRNANVTITGDTFGIGTYFQDRGEDASKDEFNISLSVQYGTANVTSTTTKLHEISISYKDDGSHGEQAGTLNFNGATVSAHSLRIDQYGKLNNNSLLTIDSSASDLTSVENKVYSAYQSAITGTGSMVFESKSASKPAEAVVFEGSFAQSKVTLDLGTAAKNSQFHGVNNIGEFDILNGSKVDFNRTDIGIKAGTTRIGTLNIHGISDSLRGTAQFYTPVTIASAINLYDYADFYLYASNNVLGQINYLGSHSTMVVAAGETIVNDLGKVAAGQTDNGINILKDAWLALTKDFIAGESPVAIYGKGTLRLVGATNAELGDNSGTAKNRLLYGLEIGSGTATVSTGANGYYSLGKLTFTNEGQGTLALTPASRLILTDSLETKKGTKIDAADATIQLYCNGETCVSDAQTGVAKLGGDAEIGELRLWKGGLTVSGTTTIKSLEFKDDSTQYIEIASGGVLNLGMNSHGNVDNKIFRGEGTLNIIQWGHVFFQTGSDTLDNLNIYGHSHLTGEANILNTNIYDEVLNFNGFAYNVLPGGAFNLFENGTIDWGTNGRMTVYGTANFNKATGSNATNKLVADGGTLNYNYTNQTASESVTLKNGATLNVNGTANFGGLKSEKSNASAGNSVLNVAGKLAQVNFVDSLIKDLTLTGTGTILAVSSVNLNASSKIDGLNEMQLQSNLTLNGNEHSLNALQFRNGGSSLTLKDDAVLNVYDKITFSTDDGYVNGDGTLVAKSSANFSVHTGTKYLKNMHIEKGATVGIANDAVRSLIKNIKNEGVLSLADTDTLYTETVQSTGTIRGEGKNLYLENAGNSVFSGSTTLQTLNVIADGAVANLSGTLNIKDLYMNNGAAHILSDSFFDRIGTSHAGSNAKLTVSANVSTNEIYGSLKTGGDGVLTLTGTATDYSEITPDSLNRLIVGENQKVKFPAGTLKNADIAGEMLVESGKSVSFGTLNLAKGSTSEIGGTITVSNDFYLNPDAELTSNGTIRLNGANNVINKSGAIFAGTFDLGSNTATTFLNSANVTNLTLNDNSRVNLAQNKLVVNGTMNVAGAAASPAMIAMKFTELDSESGVLDLTSGTLAGSGSLAFDVTVDYSAVASDRQEIKAVTGKNKSDFDAAGVALPTHHNLRYRWDVKDSCTSGDGVCYSLTVIKTAEELAKEYSSNKNDAATAKGMLDDGLFTHAMSETYALASHLHNLSQTDSVNYVKALNAVSPDVSGARTWQANGMQNRVMGTLNSRMTALIPALTRAPEPVNWRARGRSGGSPYETRWMNRDRYRKAAGYEDYAPAPERAGEMRRVNSSDYFGETATDARGKAVDFNRGATKRTVPASEYYRRSYEPSKKAQESGYTKRYESADSYGVRKYREKKGRTVKDVNFGAWAQAFYAKSKIDGDSGFDGDATGFAFGFDGSVTEHLILGLGYSNTSSDADSGQHSLTTTNDAFFLYGMYKPSNWYYSGVLTYGSSDTDETADFTGGLKKTYSYGGSFISAQLMAGLDTQTPVSAAGGLRFTTLSTDSYERSGQKVSGFTSNTLTLIAEGRYAKDYMNETQDAIFRPEARLALTYDFVNKSENAQVTLPNNVTYRVEGEDVGKVGFELGLSASYNFTNTVEVSAGWDGEFKSGYSNNTFSAKLRFNF